MHPRFGVPRGFAALLATIIISLVLLAMVVEKSFVGWYARFIVLGTQNREEARTLAEGCAWYAAAALVADSAIVTPVSISIPAGSAAGTCVVRSVLLDTPTTGRATVAVGAEVGGAYADQSVVIDRSSGTLVSMVETDHP